MRSNSAEEPRWVQKEPIKNRSSKNAQYVSHGFIGRPVHPVKTGPCDRRVRRLRLPETTQDLPRYRARDPSRRALGCFRASQATHPPPSWVVHPAICRRTKDLRQRSPTPLNVRRGPALRHWLKSPLARAVVCEGGLAICLSQPESSYRFKQRYDFHCRAQN
jgi:hypothetical protein